MTNLRLAGIASMAEKNSYLADIGSDHAYLPILLIQNGIVQKACACDIAPGPLSSAQKNIEKVGLKDRIETILSDGFDKVPLSVDSAVIAGMGYYTARDILEKAGNRIVQLKQLLIEVNENVPLMRAYIQSKGWSVKREEMFFDRGKYYTVLDVAFKPEAEYSEEELLLGRDLMRKRSECFLNYCAHKVEQYDAILKVHPKQDDGAKQLLKEREMFENQIKA